MREPAIAGMRCAKQRSAGNSIVFHNSLDASHLGCPGALKIAEAPVAMAEHAEHGKHSFNGRTQWPGHSFTFCHHRIPDGDDSEENFKQGLGIARNVAAIWYNDLIYDGAELGIGLVTKSLGTAKSEACILQSYGLPKILAVDGWAQCQNTMDELFGKFIK